MQSNIDLQNGTETVKIPRKRNVQQQQQEQQEQNQADQLQTIPEQNQVNQDIQRKSFIDFVFLIDVTKSMDKYIKGVRGAVIEVINSLNQYGENYMGLSCYRDKKDQIQFEEVLMQQMKIENFQNSEMFKMLDSIKCYGGGDLPEDIAGAIERCIYKQQFKGWKKFLVLIADAPAHGKNFNNGLKDDYPEDDLLPALNQLIENNIKLILLEVDPSTKQMNDAIEKFYTEKMLNGTAFFRQDLLNLKTENNVNKIAEQIGIMLNATIKKAIKKKQINN